MREVALTVFFGVFPDLVNVFLNAAESFLFGDTSIGYPVETVLQQIPLFLRA
ncbi:hypothetical protein D3C85_1896130 [compost metagenome]